MSLLVTINGSPTVVAGAHGVEVDRTGRVGAAVLMYCPQSTDVESALDWFEENNATEVVLWMGPDGLVRGSGVRR